MIDLNKTNLERTVIINFNPAYRIDLIEKGKVVLKLDYPTLKLIQENTEYSQKEIKKAQAYKDLLQIAKFYNQNKIRKATGYSLRKDLKGNINPVVTDLGCTGEPEFLDKQDAIAVLNNPNFEEILKDYFL